MKEKKLKIIQQVYTGTVVGHLTKNEIEHILTHIQDKLLREKLLKWFSFDAESFLVTEDVK